MRKLAFFIVFCGSLLMLFGCADSPTDIDSENNQPAVVLVERPEFIDTRPEAVIQQFVKRATLNYTVGKKPPRPDPGGDSDPNPDPAHKYAYIVGTSDYEGTVNDLNYADDDARDMKSYLQGEGFTCRIDTDRNATADAIAAGLQWLINSASPGDEIFFSYSGHGYKSGSIGGSSLISTDMYYLNHSFVMEIVNAANCSKIMVALDCCVIGDFHSDTADGTLMSTASDKSNSYDAPEFTNGAWTHFFLEAANNQNMDFGEDISSYAEREMKAWARQYRIRATPKHTDRYTGMFDI